MTQNTVKLLDEVEFSDAFGGLRRSILNIYLQAIAYGNFECDRP